MPKNFETPLSRAGQIHGFDINGFEVSDINTEGRPPSCRVIARWLGDTPPEAPLPANLWSPGPDPDNPGEMLTEEDRPMYQPPIPVVSNEVFILTPQEVQTAMATEVVPGETIYEAVARVLYAAVEGKDSKITGNTVPS